MKFAKYFYILFALIGVLFFVQAYQDYQAGKNFWLNVLLGAAAIFYAGFRIRMFNRYTGNRK